MTIIDTHVHIYPDAIAQKAAQSIGDFYNMPVKMDGRLTTLFDRGGRAGVTRFLVHSVATTPDRVPHINDYLMETAAAWPDKLIGFGAMHPDYPDVAGELKRIQSGGLRGVKLHPDIQRFLLDSDASLEMFEAMDQAHLPVLVHMGDYRYPYSQPARMAKVLTRFPGLRVIGAHLGGWTIWDEAWKTLAKYDNFWVDTSSSLFALQPEKAVEIIRHYGPDKVFFGTDFPLWDPMKEIERFQALPLTDGERERILHLNFEKFIDAFTGPEA